MKTFFPFLLFLTSISAYTQTEKELVVLRNLSDEAHNNSKVAVKFSRTTQELPNNKAIYIGYKALSELIKAKHAFAPYNKIGHFSKGKDLLEKAIKMEPTNLELRYLRFVAQTNTPGILNYDQNIELDKKIMLRYMHTKRSLVDDHLFNRIKNHMLNSSSCSTIEKNSLRNKE